MACPEWAERILTHLYAEADAAERGEVEAHLSRCPLCRQTAQELQGVRDALRDAAPELPATPRVLVIPDRPPRARYALAAAVVAASLLGAGFFFGQRTGRPEPAAAQALEASLQRIERLEQELQAQRRLLQQWGADRTSSRASSAGGLTREELEQVLASFRRELEVGRSRDLEALLEAIEDLEVRTGARQDWLEYLVLASDPRALPR